MSRHILLFTAVVLVVIGLCYALGNEREGIYGNSDIHFVTARTYGLVPKTVADTARTVSVKSGRGGELLGLEVSPTGRQQLLKPHSRPSHSEGNYNPLLAHQRYSTGGNTPSVLGDPIRTPTYVGPSVSGYPLHAWNVPRRNAYNVTTSQSFASLLAQTVEAEETAAERPQYSQSITGE